MPATLVIVLEKRPRLADVVRKTIAELPARLIEARSLADLDSALSMSNYPISLIAAENQEEIVPAALTACHRADAQTVLCADKLLPKDAEVANQLGVISILRLQQIKSELPILVRRMIENSQIQSGVASRRTLS